MTNMVYLQYTKVCRGHAQATIHLRYRASGVNILSQLLSPYLVFQLFDQGDGVRQHHMLGTLHFITIWPLEGGLRRH